MKHFLFATIVTKHSSSALFTTSDDQTRQFHFTMMRQSYGGNEDGDPPIEH